MCDEFSCDAHGDLGDGLRADVDADRSKNRFERLGGNAFVDQIFKNQTDLSSATNHA